MTMKFFNWMHRKVLHSSDVYSRVPQKPQPDVFNDVKESEADEAVLLSNVLNGILAIGTLGIDSNYNSSTQYEYDKKNKQDQVQKQEEEEEVKGLVLPIVTMQQVTKLKEGNEKKRNVEMLVIYEMKNNNGHNSHKDHITEPLLKEDKEKKESKRITLADLFAAADISTDKGSLINSKEKPAKTTYIERKCKHNKKVAFEKKEEKLMWKINNPTGSTKQVHRLITKVLKKKVHPEMGVGGAMKEMEKISLVEERKSKKGLNY